MSCATYISAPDCAVAGYARKALLLGAAVSAPVLPLAAVVQAAPLATRTPQAVEVRAAAPSAHEVAARLVLSAADVGPAYRFNTSVSGSRTLSEVSYGDTPSIVRYLQADWLGGTESAFNGKSIGIISVADVFRPGAPVNAVLKAWQADAESFTGGTFEPVPKGYPGGDPALISGTVVNYGILIYMWRDSRVIATLEITGKPAQLRLPLLIDLARRQDAGILRARSALPTAPFT